MSRFLVMFALVVVGCSKDKGPEPKSAASGSAVAPAPVEPSPPPAEAPKEPVVVVKPGPKDLPPFGGTASAADKKTARELANQALSGRTDDAVATAVAAIKKDPGSALARYAVACAAGDEAFDLEQLTPLTTATGCADCVDLVRNLGMIDGYECHWSAGVTALANSVKPSAQRAAAEAVIKSLEDRDPKHAAPYLTLPKVELSYACSTCGGQVPPTRKQAPGTKQLDELLAQLKKADADEANRIVIYPGLACAANCCGVHIDQLQHNHDFFDKVCFKPGTDQVQRIAIILGG